MRTVRQAATQSLNLEKVIFRHHVQDFLAIAGGVVMASIGLKGFLLPNDFVDGGAMGVSLLLEILTRLDLSILIILVNLPFILIGVRQISFPFALKSSLAILALAILVHYLEFPVITQDKLLIAVFGGFFLGAGIGLAIRGGAVIDGTEVMAISVSRRSSLSVGDFIALFNIALFSLAAFMISLETALYSMLTYIAASRTVDFILNGIEEYIGVMIVSNKSDDIRTKINYEMGRGLTIFKSEQSFARGEDKPLERNILFCVITRLEVSKLLFEVEKIDDKAFVIQYPIKDTKGGMIKKRRLH